MKLAKKMKSVLVALLACTILITSVPVAPVADAYAADTCVINTSTTYQTIKGFGGINLPEWVGSDLTDAQRLTAFGNGDNQLGLSILRIYISDNPDDWYKTVETAKYAQSMGCRVFATPWNPPSDLCETFTRTYTSWDGSTVTQENQKRLAYSNYGAYAQHLNDFIAYMKENGVNLYAVSVQNEPDYAHDWTWWTAEECVNFIANYGASINCSLMSPETFQYNHDYYTAILNNTAAFNNIDFFATHFYGTTRANMDFPALESSGKEIWMTEVYVPNSDADSADLWPDALEVSENIHNGLVVGNMSAYVWWYIRRGYGLIKEDGNISKRGYCMAQYSKFVRPWSVRVAATEQPADDVYVSAYTRGNQLTIVAVNSGSSSYSQNFSVQGGKSIVEVDRYRTSSYENLAKTENLPTSGNSFWAYLPSNSVSTFVIEIQ